MPTRSCTSLGMEAWVIMAGSEISFDSAETFRQGAKLNVIEETARGIERAKIEGQLSPGTLLLEARDVVLRMRRQAGVKNLAHLRMRIQMTRDADAIALCCSMRTATS